MLIEAPADEIAQWAREPLARIEKQTALVASLDPGSERHRLATGILLILQDSFHAMSEAKAIIEGIRRRRRLEQRLAVTHDPVHREADSLDPIGGATTT